MAERSTTAGLCHRGTGAGSSLVIAALVALIIPTAMVWILGMNDITRKNQTLANLQAKIDQFDHLSPDEQRASIKRRCPQYAEYIADVGQFSVQLENYRKAVEELTHVD